MKIAIVLMIVFIVIALGCTNEVTKADEPNKLIKVSTNQTNGLGIYKIEDDNNICYVLYRYDSGGISCLKK